MSYFGFCRRLTERILKNEQIKLFIAANKFSHSELKSLLVVSSNKTFCGLSHNFACFQPFFILNSRAFDIIQHKNNVIFQSHHRHHRPCVAEEIFHNLFFCLFSLLSSQFDFTSWESNSLTRVSMFSTEASNKTANVCWTVELLCFNVPQLFFGILLARLYPLSTFYLSFYRSNQQHRWEVKSHLHSFRVLWVKVKTLFNLRIEDESQLCSGFKWVHKMLLGCHGEWSAIKKLRKIASVLLVGRRR